MKSKFHALSCSNCFLHCKNFQNAVLSFIAKWQSKIARSWFLVGIFDVLVMTSAYVQGYKSNINAHFCHLWAGDALLCWLDVKFLKYMSIYIRFIVFNFKMQKPYLVLLIFSLPRVISFPDINRCERASGRLQYSWQGGFWSNFCWETGFLQRARDKRKKQLQSEKFLFCSWKTFISSKEKGSGPTVTVWRWLGCNCW